MKTEKTKERGKSQWLKLRVKKKNTKKLINEADINLTMSIITPNINGGKKKL